MNKSDIADAFAANMGTNAPFWKALKEWNAKNKLKSWCVPSRGTPEYLQVMKIMEEKYAQKKKKKTGSAQKYTATSILQAAVRRKNVNSQNAAAQPAQAAAQPVEAAAQPAQARRRGTRNRRKTERLKIRN